MEKGRERKREGGRERERKSNHKCALFAVAPITSVGVGGGMYWV